MKAWAPRARRAPPLPTLAIVLLKKDEGAVDVGVKRALAQETHGGVYSRLPR